jgi:hypothetical protein
MSISQDAQSAADSVSFESTELGAYLKESESRANLHVRGRVSVRPNPSLSPRPTTAGGVSPVPAVRSIIGHRAYAACLRGRG